MLVWNLMKGEALFDWLEHRWEGAKGQRWIGNLLILSFVAGLAVIEASRQGWITHLLGIPMPTNHFYAVAFTFKMLLIAELAGLIFGLAHSVANAVGKQIEILSLILLRDVFKEFTTFSEPIIWSEVEPAMVPMLSQAGGALLVFVVLGFYYRVQRHRAITDDAQDLVRFVQAKKLISLGILAAFAVTGIYGLYSYFLLRQEISFFELSYTILIFADVLIVLVSLRYSSTYAVVFRNSGFAIATVAIRLTLVAPPPINAVLGVGSALFALGLTVAYNTFSQMPERAEA